MSATPFMDFLEPFLAGWNAYKEHGHIDDDPTATGADLIRIAKEAFEHSGPRMAAKVVAGELTEIEARLMMEARRGRGS